MNAETFLKKDGVLFSEQIRDEADGFFLDLPFVERFSVCQEKFDELFVAFAQTFCLPVVFQRFGYVFLCQIDVSRIEPVTGLGVVGLKELLVETESFFVFSGHEIAPADGSAGVDRCLVEVFHLEEVRECLVIHSLGGETLAYLEQQAEVVRLDFLDFLEILQGFRIE